MVTNVFDGLIYTKQNRSRLKRGSTAAIVDISVKSKLKLAFKIDQSDEIVKINQMEFWSNTKISHISPL